MVGAVAIGGGAVGGPEALRLLLTVAGRSPLLDIGIVLFVVAAVTAPALGTMLLARFFRKPPGARRASGRGAVAADGFAMVTLVISLAVVFTVTACLLVEQFVVAGGFGPFPLVAVALAAVVVVAGAVPGPVRDAVQLSRFFRGVSGAAPAPAPATPATNRVADAAMLVSCAVVSFAAACLLLVPHVAAGGLDAQGLLFAFTGQSRPVHANVLVGFATVIVSALLALLSHRGHNATAAQPPAMGRFPSMISVTITTHAVVLFLSACLLAIPWTNRAGAGAA
uniref:Uncharacterized protein n=1 Tax=Oryza brachyantha TaxID=4533 RepID=J3MC50_ORYBR